MFALQNSDFERKGIPLPFYFETCRQEASNGAGSTETEHLLFLTASQQESAAIKAIYGNSIFGTAGGGKLRAKQASTAGSGGAAQTVSKRNSRSPAAGLVATNAGSAFTAGTGTVVQRLTVGLAQTGGQGAWAALEDSAAIRLQPNGGAAGNLELWSIMNAASVPLDMMVEHSEG